MARKNILRGVSPIVAIILLILVSVVGAVIFFQWFHGTASDNPTSEFESTPIISVKGVDVDLSTGKLTIYIHNTGRAADRITAVYLLDSQGNIVYKWDLDLEVKAGGTEKITLTLPGPLLGGSTYFVKVAGSSATSPPYQVPASGCRLPDGWTYYRLISISNPTGVSLEGFPVRVELDNGNFDFTHAKSDGSDVRFYTLSCRELSFWKEEWDPAGGHAVIWVKLPEIKPGLNTILMIYGNPSAPPSPLEDPGQVFIFFDDFDGTALDTGKWGVSASYTVGSGWIEIYSGGIYTLETLPDMGIDLAAGSYVFEAKIEIVSSDGSYSGAVEVTSDKNGDGFTESGNSGSDATVLYMRNTDDASFYVWIGTGATSSYDGGAYDAGFDLGNNVVAIVGFAVSSDKVSCFENYTLKTTVSGISWNDPFIRFSIGAFDGSSNIDDTRYDWARIRPALSPDTPDPIVSVGEEKTI